MIPLGRWRIVATLALAAGVVAPLGVVRWARDRSARGLAERDAAAVAAYVQVVTPVARGGADYDLGQLLIRARALDRLPGWSARVEVYHATAPLVRATAAPLDADLLERLRRKVAVRWLGESEVALAPLLDRTGWDVVGAVAARPSEPGWPVTPWLAAALLLLLVAGVQALRARPAPHEGQGLALKRYWAAAALFGVAAFADVRLAAAGGTDRWLDDVRVLMQDAAARVPDVRSAPAGLAGIARGGALVPADSGRGGVGRRVVGGVTRATAAVRLAQGRWVALVASPDEAGTAMWLPLTLGMAALAPLGAWLGVWAGGAAPRRRRETLAAWTFLSPSLLHLIICSAVPLLLVPYLSVHRWSPAEPFHPFVGVANYGRVVADTQFWSALWHTLLYACSVPLSLALGLTVALVLPRRRTPPLGLLLPYLASVVAAGLIWHQLYDPDLGVIGRLLARAGLAPADWLGDPRRALAALTLVSVWTQFGYYVTLFLAGLASIPPAFLEAARVDGAGAWQRLRRVTLPLLQPVVLFALVTGAVGAFQVLPLVIVLTGGGPLHATDVIAFHIYRTAWEGLRFGEAAAQALILFALLFGAAWAQLKLLDRRVDYA